ncbi:MAG: hypothetical protein Q9163_005984 [Psora crenata]
MQWFVALSIGSLAICLLWTAATAYKVTSNYLKARQLGFPIVVGFIDPLNPLWILSYPTLLPLLRRLPFGLGDSFTYISLDWNYKDTYRSHEKYGDAFILVNPRRFQIIVADATAIDDILTRRKDFTKPEILYKALDCFGPNVDSAEGATWQRHRKITSPPFNERNSALVWKESLRQATDMHKFWVVQNEEGATSTAADTLTLALHVLTSAGFGQSYSFLSGPEILPPGHTMSYRNALRDVLTNFSTVISCNHELIKRPYMPKSLQKVGNAIQECRTYMAEMIHRERQLTEKRDSGAGNLLSSLIRAADDGKAASCSLNDEEIMGNLFIYSLAGHETTANTLAYAVILLSVNPSLQDWLHEELAGVLGQNSSPDEWQYETIFPDLRHCLAVILYGPVFWLLKETKESPQMIKINGRECLLPQGAFAFLNLRATHTHPKYWGFDSLEWKPKRWISSDSSGETMREPPVKEAYKPWAEGARVCPGKKFSQVEFVAVMAVLFRDWKVSPKLKYGESMEQAQQRVMDVVNDSTCKITLRMNNPESVGLVWTKR